MLDSSDAESLADEFDGLNAEEADYYSEEAEEVDYYSDSDGGSGYDSDICLDTTQVKNYSILKEEDIRRLQADDIATVSNFFSISKVAACILLRHYNWSVGKVDDAWFNDEDGVRRTVGLLENPVVQFSNAKELTCGICFDSYPRDSIDTAACGHPYCSSCWTGYITTSINDGLVCLSLKCPEPSCGSAVGQDMINRHASDEYKEKYSHLLLRSYIEDNKKKMKWCPAPGCECAVDFSGEGGGVYDVTCLCSYKFCWNCTEEVHRPVNCSTVRDWLLKNKSESENVNWIIANSKPCSRCKRPIEKNQGCMHMVCSAPCNFQFCWLCLGEWSGHDDYYDCNSYEAAKRDGAFDKIERRRERAKNSLERYTHYYERWAANQLSREQALVSLQQMEDLLGLLSDLQCQPESQLKFITEAWLQIVECRRVLKWAYAYGYFMPEKERAKKRFFEYLQGEAESGLERLHQCAEKELQTFLNARPSEDFIAFRSKLAGLTSVTRNYFENLVKALENGLEDVDAHTACTKAKTKELSENEETSKGKSGKKKGKRAKSRASSSNAMSDE